MERYIAHFKKENDKIIEQSVKSHLVQTAVLAGQSASKVHLTKVGELIGILHDSGKFDENGFQNYIRLCEEYEMGHISHPPTKGSVDHGIFGAAYVFCELRNKDDAIEELLAEIMIMVIAYHHGGLKDYIGLDGSTPLWTRLERYVNNPQSGYEENRKNFESEFSKEFIQNLYTQSVQELKRLNNEKKKKWNRFQIFLLIKFLYSCLIDADREDTRMFMENVAVEENNNLVSWEEYETRLENYLTSMKKRPVRSSSEEHINYLREKISENCLKAGEWPCGVYKLTVPTGGGKTFSSTRMAIRYMKNHAEQHGKAGHIIQVLPRVSIIEQNADAVRSALRCGDDLLEHHSNVILEEGNNDEAGISKEKYRLLTERWSSKFIFTTTVQFLNTPYTANTQDVRRMHNLANSIIIMDEVQALPLKTLSFFKELLDFLTSFCNTAFVLCSATQPNYEKIEVFKERTFKEIIPNVDEIFRQFQRMDVIDALKCSGYIAEELVDFVRERMNHVTSALIVMNTKKTAKKIYDALIRDKSEGVTYVYISTELCPEHRRNVINKIRILLKNKQPVICVSTSILEAGVDISFETVIRNIAGLDSVAQSSGRGNRHGENAVCGRTYIVNIQDEQLGSMFEISIGEEKTKSVLDTYRRCPEYYGNSLLSPKALEDYFSKYFAAGEIRKQMDYPVNKDVELKMLCSYYRNSKIFKRRYMNRTGGMNYEWTLTYPFETGGKEFHVIEQEAVSVLVPYGEGKDIINEIWFRQGEYQIGELKRLLERAKPYFVTIYTNQLKKYQSIVELSPLSGILILNDGCYDESTGIQEENKLNFLQF